MAGDGTSPIGQPTGGVQSVERVLDLLEAMADAGGVAGLSDLAASSGLPLPTIHRLVRTLVDRGYVRQEPSRQYALGPRLIRLGESASRMVGTWAAPHLTRLVDALGESANLALFDGGQVVYVAQVPGRHSMRMFTEVGRRVSPHCTAVGKAILAQLPPARVHDVLRRTDFVAHTPTTITDPATYLQALDQVREQGHAMDEGEQEIGVRCVAVGLDSGPAPAALSISGPTTRMTDDLIERAVPELRAAADALAAELSMQRAVAGA
ncbi:IclR family transcriptional regulator [Pseudonocardia nigra]|uniref:IclR family transcriptional regulator n=1 Tax=Pseudonocardia nigra TaxID=1921578 RepID=UPI001C605001|nr:IclR family transcriptional regulator [Pseudonocardia nigra]